MNARRRGEDVIDLSMGNPDGPTPQHIVDKLVEAAQRQDTHGYSVSKGIPRLRRAISTWYQRRYGVELDPGFGSDRHHRLEGGPRAPDARVPRARRHGARAQPVLSDPHLRGDHRRRRHPLGAHDAGRRLLRRARARHPRAHAQAQDAGDRLPVQPHRAMRRPGFLRAHRGARAPAQHPRRPRPRVCRHRVRFLQGALDHAGARRARRGGRVLHHVEELQHGRLAHRLHGRQPRARARPRAHQELSRLRQLHAHPGRLHRRARGAARLCFKNKSHLPKAQRRNGEGPARHRLAGRGAEGVDVHLGEDPRASTPAWVRSSSPSACSRARRSRWRRASASATTATTMCASPSSRTTTACARQCAASATCSERTDCSEARRDRPAAGDAGGPWRPPRASRPEARKRSGRSRAGRQALGAVVHQRARARKSRRRTSTPRWRDRRTGHMLPWAVRRC